uniref:aECM cysteine-cradle domain-containing protein n=1 Tax=Strongyloides papillosus TaxID=174720 RepID=A0A0N5C918_STREA
MTSYGMPIFFGILIMLLINNIVINGQDTGRIIDIRKIVKDTLDYVRTVPAPEPFKSMIYNPVIQQQNPQVLPIVNGQNLPIGASQVFAPPSRNDVDKLFHLPADILEKLASDAGYIPEKKPTYSNYKETSQVLTNPSPSLGGFNFNVANENGKQQTMEEIIQQLQAQVSKAQTPPMKVVTENVQIEPVMTTTTVPSNVNNGKMIDNINSTDSSQINTNNNFNILSQISDILAGKQTNETLMIQSILASTTETPSLIQQTEKTTSPPISPPSSADGFNLHGQEIILNGQKYILTKPTSEEDSENVKNNFVLKGKNEEEGENKLDSNEAQRSSEYTSNEKEIEDQSNVTEEEKDTTQEMEDPKVTTTIPDEIKGVTLAINPATKTVTSESGSFVQAEFISENTNPQTTKNLPKSLELLLMEQLEKEQIKGAEEQRKFLLRQRTPVDDNSLPSIFFNNEDELKKGKQLTPISIHKLSNTPLKEISINIDKVTGAQQQPIEDRVERLRKSFNEQRRILAFKSRQLFSRNKLTKSSQPFLAVTFCQKLSDMSKEIGSNDIVEMAEENCKLITNYYPDLTCNEVLQYAEHCLLLMKLEKKN